MSLPVRITAREQVGDRIHLRVAEGATFEECLDALRKLREQPASVVTPISVAPEGGAMQSVGAT